MKIRNESGPVALPWIIPLTAHEFRQIVIKSILYFGLAPPVTK